MFDRLVYLECYTIFLELQKISCELHAAIPVTILLCQIVTVNFSVACVVKFAAKCTAVTTSIMATIISNFHYVANIQCALLVVHTVIDLLMQPVVWLPVVLSSRLSHVTYLLQIQ